MNTQTSEVHTAVTDPPAVELRDIGVHFSDTAALEHLTLTVNRGECLALLGASGSGKSTALNCIAGFITPTTGTVHLNGADATTLPPAKRGLGFVVQSYALFPHMNVRNNIAFGLKTRRLPSVEIRARVEEVAALVGMSDYLDRKPGQLSGGQQQRVAMARALAIRPSVLLLDEPTSALDTRLREQMIDELKRLRRDLPDVAMIVVTHDQNEAMALADRIALLHNGRCEAWDTAESLFYTPPTEYTATFLGNAAILPAHVVDSTGTAARVRIFDHETHVRTPHPVPGGTHVSVALRPWHWDLTTHRDTPGLCGTVEGAQWRGAAHRYRVRINGVGDPIPVDLPDAGTPLRIGDNVRIYPQPGAAVIISSPPADEQVLVS